MIQMINFQISLLLNSAPKKNYKIISTYTKILFLPAQRVRKLYLSPLSTIISFQFPNCQCSCSRSKPVITKEKHFFPFPETSGSRMGDTFIAEVLQPRFKTRPCLELCLHSQRGGFYRRPYTTV